MNSKPKLLYAEDNRLTAKEMTEILEEEGYEVVTTYSGDEAWETFQRISPDLVLLDFRMPGLNGLEVFERIRQANAEIPVLILSSYNEYCVPSLKSGTADFIRKAWDIDGNGFSKKFVPASLPYGNAMPPAKRMIPPEKPSSGSRSSPHSAPTVLRCVSVPTSFP